jgi:flagellar basal-body rod modification protein FlgD
MITIPSKSPVFDSTPSSGAGSSTGTSGSSSTAAAAQPGGDLGKDAFMKLLIAQMQNQDPMNPMDGTQMASQLAQFSSLEQLQEINTTLTGQASSSDSVLGAIQSSAAINTIGHSVIATGNQVAIGGDGGATSVQVNIASPAAAGVLHILNSAGVEVATQTLGSMGAGKQWINLSDAAKALPPGTYTFSIDAKDTTSTGIMLSSGPLAIPYSNVIQILK